MYKIISVALFIFVIIIPVLSYGLGDYEYYETYEIKNAKIEVINNYNTIGVLKRMQLIKVLINDYQTAYWRSDNVNFRSGDVFNADILLIPKDRTEIKIIKIYLQEEE